jgi:hypothetical protein
MKEWMKEKRNKGLKGGRKEIETKKKGSDEFKKEKLKTHVGFEILMAMTMKFAGVRCCVLS